MPRIRITGVQMTVSDKLEENLPKILDAVLPSDADFVVFPEMALTGYHGEFSQKSTAKAWEQIAAACRQTYACAVVGTGAKDDGHTHIQARVFAADGDVQGTYDKIIPTEADRKFCRPGGTLQTFEHASVTFGCLICNDLWVSPGSGPYPDPRLSLQLAKKGVDLIIHQANSGTDGAYAAYHEANLKLRAKEARVPIVTVNAASPMGPVNSLSGIVSSEGEWLINVSPEGEQTFTYDLEIET